MKSVLVIIMVLMGYWLCAQDVDTTPSKQVLTLDQCMKIAMQNNIELKRVKNNALIANANYFQRMMEFLPSIDLYANYDLYNGTFFDNTAARQVTSVTNSSNPSIRANWTVFNGFSNHYQLKAANNNKEATSFAIEEQVQTVESNVLAAYLSVVLDKENIKISEDKINLLQSQLEREKKRNEIGVGNLEQVYNFQSQLANENLTLVNRKNLLLTDMLRLLQTLQLEVSDNYDVAPYEFGDDLALMEKEKFAEVLESSLSYSPGIKRATHSAESASMLFKSSRAQYLPTVALSGQVGSSYSSNGARNPENGMVDSHASFSDQMNWNRYDYLNLSVTVPVFYRGRLRNDTQVAKLNLENANLDLQQTELDVTNTIQQVYVNLTSAQATYKAAEDNLVALNQSFEYVETRYEHGNTDFYTYLESLNNKNRAEIELVNAKYMIVFRQKILDVYRGQL
ncbi:TolC family protein [Reichenbachiella agarivorans]|uniref:TolC family protein n=1 Tax=Reichenbachiella agarivorans TaxID=2979464 RepID=A0ABY6CU25_9BACT|nr:TolC family protein [Reichenbachiella agarivorans]UXP34016.1 TolC family protein [Reichenbachiella agarivorans]